MDMCQHCWCKSQTSPTQMPRNSRMGTSWYSHTMELHQEMKTCNLPQNNNMEESYKRYMEPKKLGSKYYIPNDFMKLKCGPYQFMVRDVSLAVTLGGWVAPARGMREPLGFCKVLFLDLVPIILCYFKTVYQAAPLQFMYISVDRFYVKKKTYSKI